MDCLLRHFDNVASEYAVDNEAAACATERLLYREWDSSSRLWLPHSKAVPGLWLAADGFMRG
jgi:hypothetical protein